MRKTNKCFEIDVSIDRKGLPITVVAKLDTGAALCSIDYSLATLLGSQPHRTAMIRSANGKERRDVVWIDIEFNGIKQTVETTLTIRDGLTYPMLLGFNALGNNSTITDIKNAVYREEE